MIAARSAAQSILLDQREVLVDHADAEILHVLRSGDPPLVSADRDLAAIRAVEAHQALHQCRLSRPVLAEKCMEAVRRETVRDIV